MALGTVIGVPEGRDGSGEAEDCGDAVTGGVAVGAGPAVGLGDGITGTAGVKVNVDGLAAGLRLGVAGGLLTGEVPLAVGLGGGCLGEDKGDGLAAVGLDREVGTPT